MDDTTSSIDSDSGLSAHAKLLRKEGGEGNDEDDKDDEDEDRRQGRQGGTRDEEHEEPKAPDSFFPANLLAIMIVGVLSNCCDPSITHVCETEGETQIAKVPSRNDARMAGLNQGLSISVISSSVEGIDT